VLTSLRGCGILISSRGGRKTPNQTRKGKEMKYWMNEKTQRIAILSHKPTDEPWARVSGEWVEITKDEYDTMLVYQQCLVSLA